MESWTALKENSDPRPLVFLSAVVLSAASSSSDLAFYCNWFNFLWRRRDSFAPPLQNYCVEFHAWRQFLQQKNRADKRKGERAEEIKY